MILSALLGLVSLGGLSLFLARFLQRSSALTPLLSVALGMIWFTVFGVANALLLGGWLWYALCFVALLITILYEKKKLVSLFTPGFLFFFLGGVFFTLLFFATNPLFIEWDAFTFWGTALKAMFEQGELYTTAQSNLLSRSYPPGLLLFCYMVQFFSPTFSEGAMLAGYSFVYLASFSAASAFWKKQKAAAVIFLCGLFLLPLFFEPGTQLGEPSWAYHTVMSDLPMAALFGGILGYAFSEDKKGWRFFFPLGCLLAALTNVKDMGFALALLALWMIGVDLLCCERKELTFLKVKRTKGWFLGCFVCLLMIVGMYLLWAAHLAFIPSTVDRFNLGSAGQELSMSTMMLQALGAMFGFSYHEQYSQVLPLMVDAFFTRPVSLLGPGVYVFLLILGILLAAYFLSTQKIHRRRILVFALTSTAGFLLFYLFHIILYAFIFKPVEALVLKDYLRYLTPYWQGWLMASLVLLGISCVSAKELRLRVQLARLANVVFTLCLLGLVIVFSHPSGNFLFVSPSKYSVRNDIGAIVKTAQEQGMQQQHTVYVLSQGDDGTRSYQYRYALNANMALQYAGVLQNENGDVVQQDGQTLYVGNVGGTMVENLETAYTSTPFPAAATREDFEAFLRQEQVTHVLIDVLDNYILDEFRPLFSDGLEGWSDDETLSKGHRYYRVTEEDGRLLLVPEEGGGEA